jgi:glycerol-3-phosphate acyltransferase PlsY
MTILKTLLLMGVSYLLGSVPFSYLIARTQGVDLRTVGSGNLGAGNVWRNCGFKPFLATIVLDILKGAAMPLVAMRALKLPPLSVVLAGGCAMLGHTFSLYMNFRGGKAVATAGGVLLAVFPSGVLAAAASWFAAVFVTRITSVGSLVGAAVAVVSALAMAAKGRLDRVYAAFVCVAGAMVFVLHRSNIKRLLQGTESRVQKLF